METNPSKIEDSLFKAQDLPTNPMLEVEEECSRIEHTAHTDEMNNNSFDNQNREEHH
jgi:hypothetical protein